MNKLRILLLGCLLIQAPVWLHAQNFLNDLNNIKFFDADTAPAADWKSTDFDDVSWNNGGGLIGYGDPVDVESRHVQTIYTRSYFTLENVDQFEAMELITDFDDGFVAYINGVEIARVNMGNQVSPTTHTQLSDRSHESELYRSNTSPVLGYYIDKEFITANMKVGKNVIAIEVHNDSIDGSDLIIIGALYDLTNNEYDIFNFFSRYKRCVQLDSTNLPIICIETGEYGAPYKRGEVPGTIKVINKGTGVYNKPSDPATDYSGNMVIELRGESSSTFPKKPYDIELVDEQGNDTSVSLLGMPRESDWVLQGPFADKSQIRNAIAYELGLKTGHWAPRLRFCEVIFNGEFVGLYNLIEKIKRDSNRVDVKKLQPDEISGVDLTGGYIIKYDKGDNRVQVVYPTASDLQPEQLDYIRNFIKEYEGKLLSNDGLDPEKGYKKYIDPESLIDNMIVCELIKNCDSYLYSSYMYKDRDDVDPRLKFGPLWDYDLSMGNSVWQEGYKTDGWQFEVRDNYRFRIKRLLEDPEMVEKFKNRWHELRGKYLSTDSLFIRIDELTSSMADAIDRNYEVWPIESEGPFFPYYIMPTYEDEIQYMKDWLAARTEWIDANIDNIYYPVTDYSNVNDGNIADNFSSNIYPNPFSNEFYIDINLPQSGNLNIELINVQGKVVQTIANSQVEQGQYKVYWKKGDIDLTDGMYLLNIRIDGKLFSSEKVFHQDE